jgi:hypothetical protein
MPSRSVNSLCPVQDETLGLEYTCALGRLRAQVEGLCVTDERGQSIFGPVRRYLRAMDSICAHARC